MKEITGCMLAHKFFKNEYFRSMWEKNKNKISLEHQKSSDLLMPKKYLCLAKLCAHTYNI
jgi:hypothetical protein